MSSKTMRMKGLTLWCIGLCVLLEVTLGAVRHYKFEVEYRFLAPDSVEHAMMGINGHFPGPTIRAEVGDTLDIALTNKLSTEGTVIHWHGIRQYGTPWADGTAAISHCAIAPGETFHYRFVVDMRGTYFYHGQYGMQRAAGLYGSLIVELAKGQKEPFHYDGEFNLLLSDWWHKSTQIQESLFINGRGQYKCSMAANLISTTLPQCKFRGNEECAPQILHVDPNKT